MAKSNLEFDLPIRTNQIRTFSSKYLTKSDKNSFIKVGQLVISSNFLTAIVPLKYILKEIDPFGTVYRVKNNLIYGRILLILVYVVFGL